MPNISRSDFLKQELKKIQNLFSANKFELVIEKSKKMIKKDPSQIPFYNYLALSYRELGKFNTAEEILQNALKIKPNAQSVLNNLGTVCIVCGPKTKSTKGALSIIFFPSWLATQPPTPIFKLGFFFLKCFHLPNS